MRKLKVALVGNPNVGKSVLFNQLTGGSQHVGNWPGKTIEKAEGIFNFLDYEMSVIDLPGAYSLSPYSTEEKIVSDYLSKNKESIIVTVVDASSLERGLFLTMQLIERGLRVIVALNMVDLAEEKGIHTDTAKLSRLLNVPVVPIVAVHGKGIRELVISVINQRNKKIKPAKKKSNIKQVYKKVNHIANQSQHFSKIRVPLREKLDTLLLHKYAGYLALFLVIALFFSSVFFVGDILSSYLSPLFSLIENLELLSSFNPYLNTMLISVLEGVVAGVSIALPYLIPFYILLAILEDSGYLPRIVFLMDNLMHTIGLHGKSFLPMILGYGCAVPAILCCRILGSEKQRFITAFLVTLVPCAARTVIIFGLVGAVLGLKWALLLYLLNAFILFVLGALLSKYLPGKATALIIDIPSYKLPSFLPLLRRTWFRTKHFIWIALPIIVLSTIVVNFLEMVNLLNPISEFLSPVTVGILGLPSIVGIALIIGFLRKELALLLLVSLLGTDNFELVLTPVQIMVFTVVSMFYVPCAATVATLYKEFGLNKTAFMVAGQITLAIILGVLVRFTLEHLVLF